MPDLHITPIGDLIEHDTSADGDCVCGPTEQPIRRDDGSIAWTTVHHSLDGRERPLSDTQLTVLLNERDLPSEA